MAEPYTRVNLDEVEDVAPANGFGDRWEARPARGALEAQESGLTHFRLRPGRRSPFVHRHESAEEIYVIVAGDGWIRLDGELIEVEPLDAIRVAPQVARAFEAGPNGLEFIALGAHGGNDGVAVAEEWSAEDMER